MSDLTDFLLARIAEDEANANEGVITTGRLLYECEAKRRIVGLFTRGEQYGAVLRLLTLPYVDHRDYRQEWLP